MKVLVAYASRHGATAGIAERIAARLDERGLDATAADVSDLDGVGGYDAYVVGSAAYMFHWLKAARRFVNKYAETIRSHPNWIFSSGPLGTDLVDEDGNDVLEEARPREFNELIERLQPRGDKVFFGAWDPDSKPKGFAERAFRAMPISNDVLPAGDFRDWETIDEWADEIADSLVNQRDRTVL